MKGNSLSSITPYLTVQDGNSAVAFYQQAFNAQEVGPRLVSPDGKILHTELAIDGAKFMLADEFPEFKNEGPQAFGGTPVRLNLESDDVDALAAQAIAAGAKVQIPVTDQFYGYRSGRLEDPFGHIWILSQKVEDVTNDEMQRRANEFFDKN